MALIFITTCNHFVFFPLQVKSERINKEIKGESEEPGAMQTPRFLSLNFLLSSDQGWETVNMRQVDTLKVNMPLFILWYIFWQAHNWRWWITHWHAKSLVGDSLCMMTLSNIVPSNCSKHKVSETTKTLQKQWTNCWVFFLYIFQI